MTSLRPVLVRVVKLRKSSSRPATRVLSVDGGREAVGLDRLDDGIGVGEGPGEQREGRADRPDLVAGDVMVGQDVGDQRARGVEVQDRLERRGIGQQVVVAGDRLDQQQHGRRHRQHDPEPEPGRGAANGQQYEAEDGDSEHAEDRPPGIAVLEERIDEDRRELSPEENRRRLAQRELPHRAKLVPGPAASTERQRRGWDSNPRGSVNRPHDFQSCTLSHSVTSPRVRDDTEPRRRPSGRGPSRRAASASAARTPRR